MTPPLWLCDGKWGICFFDCLYLRDGLTTAIPGISVPVTFEDLKPFRNPTACCPTCSP